MKKRLLMCIGLLLFAFVQAWAQDQQITGKVSDPKTGEGIPGVSGASETTSYFFLVGWTDQKAA